MGTNDPLSLRFDPQTVDHLGARMYSHLPNAIAELIANAYDADATEVRIRIGATDSISVEDNGHGMSRVDVAEKYLRIGRNRRRADDSDRTESGSRRVSGKKGLGKLALFGIGRHIVLLTTRAGSDTSIRVQLDYEEMMAEAGTYHPNEQTETSLRDSHGTTVSLSRLKRRSAIDATALAVSLSRLFNYADANFDVRVVTPDGEEVRVDRQLRLDAVDTEFEWIFPRDLRSDGTYLRDNGVGGRIVSSRKPLPPALRGITLYANGRMVNEPEFFGSSESSYAYSYLTGHLDIDFVDVVDSDVIATDRRALVWEADEIAQLRDALRALLRRIGQEWRERRSEARRARTEEKLGGSTDEWIGSIKAQRERESVRTLVQGIGDLDLTADQEGRLIQDVNRLAPHNADYVWRHLDPEIQDATRKSYEQGDYFQAVQEAIKRYVSLARNKAGLTIDEANGIVTSAFGAEKGKLAVFAKYAALKRFGATSVKNIEEGQKHLSMGVVAGFRNPLAHEEIEALQSAGAFTFQDCLDALSIVSHLVRRLNEAELRT